VNLSQRGGGLGRNPGAAGARGLHGNWASSVPWGCSPVGTPRLVKMGMVQASLGFMDFFFFFTRAAVLGAGE